MKKLAALLLAVCLLFGCGAAMADTKSKLPPPWDVNNQPPAGNVPIINTLQSSKTFKYSSWKANLGEGTHTAEGRYRNSNGEIEKDLRTVACDFIYFTVDAREMYVCPVCGNLNDDAVIPIIPAKNAKFNRIAPKVKPNPQSGYKWNTNGQYLIRIIAMPESSEAAFIMTACHEIAGVCYDAETMYNYVVPLPHDGIKVKYAYYGSLIDFEGNLVVCTDGLQIRPAHRSQCFGAFVMMKDDLQ